MICKSKYHILFITRLINIKIIVCYYYLWEESLYTLQACVTSSRVLFMSINKIHIKKPPWLGCVITLQKPDDVPRSAVPNVLIYTHPLNLLKHHSQCHQITIYTLGKMHCHSWYRTIEILVMYCLYHQSELANVRSWPNYETIVLWWITSQPCDKWP